MSDCVNYSGFFSAQSDCLNTMLAAILKCWGASVPTFLWILNGIFLEDKGFILVDFAEVMKFLLFISVQFCFSKKKFISLQLKYFKKNSVKNSITQQKKKPGDIQQFINSHDDWNAESVMWQHFKFITSQVNVWWHIISDVRCFQDRS